MNKSKFCSNCGQKLADGVKFCSSCGQQVSSSQEIKQEKDSANNSSKNQNSNDKNNVAKLVKNIQSSGTSSQILGWLFIISFPLLELVGFGQTDNYGRLAFYILLMVPAAIFLVYSGDKMKQLGNKLTPLFVINIILSVLSLGGIVTILVLIDLIRGMASYGKLKRKKKEIPVISASGRRLLTQLLIMGGLIVIGVGILFASVQKYYDSASTVNTKELFVQQCAEEAKQNLSSDKAMVYCKCAYDTLEPVRGKDYLSSGGEATDADVKLVQDNCTSLIQ